MNTNTLSIDTNPKDNGKAWPVDGLDGSVVSTSMPHNMAVNDDQTVSTSPLLRVYNQAQ